MSDFEISMTIRAPNAGLFVAELEKLLEAFGSREITRIDLAPIAGMGGLSKLKSDPELLGRLAGAVEGQAALDTIHGGIEPAPIADKRSRRTKAQIAADAAAEAAAKLPVEEATEATETPPAASAVVAFETDAAGQDAVRAEFSAMQEALGGFTAAKEVLAKVLAHYQARQISDMPALTCAKAINRMKKETAELLAAQAKA